ncbi:MAG: SoxR reducing system RseC family protein [Shewanellaceae bacterium]|nr:SoxR reducing system RseC family protein [Shewanellaceae bacterium]
MNQEAAVVVSQSGQNVRLYIEKKISCSGCQEKSKCGAQTVAASAQPRMLEIQTDLTLRAGDTVVVQIPDGYLTSIAMVVYAVPIFGFMVGLLIGMTLLPEGSALQDMMVLAFGFLGGYVSWIAAQHQVKRIEQTQQPLITANFGQIIHKQHL